MFTLDKAVGIVSVAKTVQVKYTFTRRVSRMIARSGIRFQRDGTVIVRDTTFDEALSVLTSPEINASHLLGDKGRPERSHSLPKTGHYVPWVSLAEARRHCLCPEELQLRCLLWRGSQFHAMLHAFDQKAQIGVQRLAGGLQTRYLQDKPNGMMQQPFVPEHRIFFIRPENPIQSGLCGEYNWPAINISVPEEAPKHS